MSEININTEAVEQAAIILTENNNTIQNRFGEVNQAMEKLANNWNGNASNTSLSAFRKIRSKYYEDSTTSRYSVMKNHINYLSEFITPEYKKTESINKRLAGRFK